MNETERLISVIRTEKLQPLLFIQASPRLLSPFEGEQNNYASDLIGTLLTLSSLGTAGVTPAAWLLLRLKLVGVLIQVLLQTVGWLAGSQSRSVLKVIHKEAQ